MSEQLLGRIHSFESFGTVDGPGIRFVVFMQGCPMRCLYCHNPDTWKIGSGGDVYSVDDVFNQIMKYKNYIKKGGVTISGGEPLVQIEFVTELLKRLKAQGLHTAVDTSGITFVKNSAATLAKFDALLEVTDLFLLDVKHIDPVKHKALTGKENKNPQDFMQYLADHNKSVWIRYVLVPGYSDDEHDIEALHTYLSRYSNIEKIEVLPYHTMGIAKYQNLNIPYPLEGVQKPSKEVIDRTKEILGVKSHANK
ncbi:MULTISPECIES: pyruvate formate-lyase-activating protein [unclassified Breznakia]|uniref:pyruvate formate-lyase-activating protein n=1 Tax=unclassified Breznakia TaxID=2623764 RepID=UPI002474B686|nr:MULTISPECIES: pyruvate formate-lyase-activating protein [unclassified Breznakia]MDH6365945.1 pyruvate formate lyase activating enzyme [Breznakia sp. PH1-1]MDH6403123.1 pyruvate formate lyase activating enzyme [Breznakia sp. PF1-11]MDH6410832.1 pyruvate formate lyase activating enzyme [Breznakia sp. PFB1-11]MDH6413111.1 pyruvate formate lyase activating enzyme [Breznakia sp. PFB1-14]MDH6415479.1 pyruvate formate lyase activating enzyme [Breznakia sp. PFB1-4]